MSKNLLEKLNQAGRRIGDDHVGAYAAQSAYFFMLSLIPLLLLLLTLVQYTPLTREDIMLGIETLFPSASHSASSLDTWLISIVNEVYNQSKAVVPVTALVAFWSAGRGVLALTTGLNCIYGAKETRNYIFLRIRAASYTLMFVLSIIISMLLLVFGNSISMLINSYVPFLKRMTDMVIGSRTIIAMCLFTLLFAMVYKYLPNHRNRAEKRKQKRLFPGAVLAAVGWLVISYVSSIYVEVFRGFSNMYGSLTMIILMML